MKIDQLVDIDSSELAFTDLDRSRYTIYRCDDFTNKHDGKHILFLGDSVTAGEGIELKDHWAYRVYTKISKTEKCSGFFNIAVPGSSVTDAIDQFYKYVELYGIPDVVFFLVTQPARDLKYIQSQGVITKFNSEYTQHYIKRMYKYFEQYCKSNDIILNSFTWDISLKSKKEQLEEKLGKVARGIFFKRNEHLEAMDILSVFKTFNYYTAKDLVEHVYSSRLETLAKDNVHPGPAFHDFYTNFIYNKYLEDINANTRN